MAKKNTSNRKAGWALRMEHQDLLDKTKSLEARIKARAIELSKTHPNVPIGDKTKAKDLHLFPFMHTEHYLGVIETIEKHIADQHPHKQLEIILDTSGSMNPSKAEKDLIAAKSRNAEFKRSVNSVRIENPETKDKRDV